MKQKKIIRVYIFLGLALLLIFVLPATLTAKLRTKAIAKISPYWHGAYQTCHNQNRDIVIEHLEHEIFLLRNELNERDKQLNYLGRENMPVRGRLVKVIYREPSLWNHFVWVDLAQEEAFLNAPVMYQESLIGCIDLIEKKSCRVRLITDPLLIPSVSVEGKSFRGELCGSGGAIWNQHSQLLKGKGFHCDKEVLDQIDVKEGDTLITSGLDGVFSAGLKIATVSKIYPLREGACSFELEAYPYVENLFELDYLEVITPADSVSAD